WINPPLPHGRGSVSLFLRQDLVALVALQIDHRFGRRVNKALHTSQLFKAGRTQQLGLCEFERSAVQFQTLPLLPQGFHFVACHQTIQRWQQQGDYYYSEGERRTDQPPANL